MNAFPLIRTKWSNEHIMAALFAVLVLYSIPRWMDRPADIINFILLVAFGLLIDVIASILRHRRLWCCVSGAVTAAMISLLSVGIPLRGQLLGVALGLIVGKHLFGGTGKNILNPALVGLFTIFAIYGKPEVFFTASWFLLPAIILGLIFLSVRPYAGIALILGMLAAMYLNNALSVHNIVTYGVLFWGCFIITDPVTVTPHPLVGSVMGALAGFLPMYFLKSPATVIIGIIVVNLFSADIAQLVQKTPLKLRAKLRISKSFPFTYNPEEMIDLIKDKESSSEKMLEGQQFTKEMILERIKEKEVFGMGGAAFSTHRKIMTVLESNAKEKYLIINGVECDPGLVHDTWLLRNQFEEILQGTELLRTCVDFKAVYLAVKNKEGLKDNPLVKIHQVRDIYPIGAEKILIEEVTGIALKKEQIPAIAGVLVLNVQTVYTIAQAIRLNKMADTRYLTVADLSNKTAKVVKVSLGMKLTDIMKKVYPRTMNIFVGGGIMQVYLAEEEAVVDNTVNFIATGLAPTYKESPQCSSCGSCSKNCPSNLQVKRIADLVDAGKFQEMTKYRVDECISCGTCTYICMAGNSLAAKVSRAKEYI